MNRKTWTLIIVGTLIVAAAGLGIYFALPHPTHLSGNTWDYTILPGEVPEDWTLVRQGVITPHDVAQENIELEASVTETVGLKNMVQLYYARYEPPHLSRYLDFTIQIILYQTDADAQGALAEGAPTEAGWESTAAPQIGDETRAWRFVSSDPTISQNLYRVDFRFLNGVASVTMIGTTDALPDIGEPAGYAQKIYGKMVNKATPKEMQRLRAAALLDLRDVLLSQDDIARLDDDLGGRWQVDPRLLPQWTPTDEMSTEAERQVLKQLGRVSGYQMFLVKALSNAEKQKTISEGLFQQVSAYTRPDAAEQALTLMIGLEQAHAFPIPPEVGDRARAWGGLLSSTGSDGKEITLAVNEIDFQVGRYVGSVRLQSRPLAESEYQSGQTQNLELAIKLATGLAVKMQAANR